MPKYSQTSRSEIIRSRKFNNDGWKVSKRGILSTTKKASASEQVFISKDNQSKVKRSPYTFSNMIGKSRLQIQTENEFISDEDLKLLRTTTPWELADNVFFSPEVFYKENGNVSVKGSVVPSRKKSSLVGMSFAVDTLASRAVTLTAMITK